MSDVKWKCEQCGSTDANVLNGVAIHYHDDNCDGVAACKMPSWAGP